MRHSKVFFLEGLGRPHGGRGRGLPPDRAAEAGGPALPEGGAAGIHQEDRHPAQQG